ncbi:MAG TPA: hypothetical protein PKY30_27020, partial [Myxococcota bacterium]|nr:hypothetical protein [Myxococcota bacterium]
MIQIFSVLLWAEGLRILRTREVYAYLLLPALLVVPLLIAGFALVRSFQDAPLVALPAEEAMVGFDLTALSTALEAKKLRTVHLPDPAAELRSGRADAAVTAIELGSGGEKPPEAPAGVGQGPW